MPHEASLTPGRKLSGPVSLPMTRNTRGHSRERKEGGLPGLLSVNMVITKLLVDGLMVVPGETVFAQVMLF